MAHVYVITNIINGKQYIGTTKFSLEKRFDEHRRDSKKDRCKNRPLYIDINKYGIDNFTIEELEECIDSDRFNKERYWIDKLDTCNNGYNLTYGGIGKQFYSYNNIAMLDIHTEDLLKTFSSASSAGLFLGNKNKAQHISEACSGKRKTAYGYKWQWCKDIS